jgi:hypothetical protein
MNNLKSTELRVGNLLHDNQDRLCKVEDIYPHHYSAPAINGPITSMPNKPIPLTEEWILKFGFNPNAKKDWWSREGITLGWITTDQNFEFEYNRTRLPTQLKYVHQLQNLFQSLTGSELTAINTGQGK